MGEIYLNESEMMRKWRPLSLIVSCELSRALHISEPSIRQLLSQVITYYLYRYPYAMPDQCRPYRLKTLHAMSGVSQ